MEQADIMTRLGLRSLVINADTIQETHQRGENIWKQADTESNIVFMAPEQLISDGFSGLVKDDTAFLRRVCLLAVDEAHILNTWGAAFRKVYRQIGWIRARLQDIILLALTASHPASFFDPAKLIGRQSRVVGKAREIQENWY